MKIERCRAFNFENALRGMRNPMNSWSRSDSCFALCNVEYDDPYVEEVATSWADNIAEELSERQYDDKLDEYVNWLMDNGILKYSTDGAAEIAYIGPKDMELAQKLINAGPEHRKFLRQIFVTMDITAPLYLWKELDTYKVATVANSTSTMHKLTTKPITLDSFEIDDFNNITYPVVAQRMDVKSSCDDDFVQMCLIPYLEYLRQSYVELIKTDPEEAKRYWKELVRWLPESWLQTRTWTCNYETLRAIYHQRKNHKLSEWKYICDFIEKLPYAKEFIIN